MLVWIYILSCFLILISTYFLKFSSPPSSTSEYIPEGGGDSSSGGGGMSQSDIDVAMMPISSQGPTARWYDNGPPVVITIGGISLQPFIDPKDLERKLSATPVLNITVSIDSRAASLSEARKFCASLQTAMNNPASTAPDYVPGAVGLGLGGAHPHPAGAGKGGDRDAKKKH